MDHNKVWKVCETCRELLPATSTVFGGSGDVRDLSGSCKLCMRSGKFVKVCNKCGVPGKASESFTSSAVSVDGYSKTCAVCKAVRTFSKRYNLPEPLAVEGVRALLQGRNYTCTYCPSTVKAGLCLKTPPSKGGTPTLDNLTPICFSCSRKKGTKTHKEFQDLLKNIKEGLTDRPM